MKKFLIFSLLSITLLIISASNSYSYDPCGYCGDPWSDTTIAIENEFNECPNCLLYIKFLWRKNHCYGGWTLYEYKVIDYGYSDGCEAYINTEFLKPDDTTLNNFEKSNTWNLFL